MRLISLDELIFGELTEFQMQAGPSFAPVSVHEQKRESEREKEKERERERTIYTYTHRGIVGQ